MNAPAASWRQHVSDAFVIFQKELLDLRRDRRALVTLIVVPALLYPLLMLAATKVGMEGIKQLDQELLTVQVAGPLPDDVSSALASMDKVKLRHGTLSSTASDADAVVRTVGPFAVDEKAPVEVVYDGATERGNVARKRLVRALKRARKQARDERLMTQGIEPEDVLVAEVVTVNSASSERKGGFVLGRALIPILLMFLMLGAHYPAVELTVGERERQTLRTLLCAPINPRTIAAGKLGAVALVAMSAASANLLGLLLTARLGIMGMDSFQVPWAAIAVAFVLLVPMSFLIGAILMAVASLAQTQREAQTFLAPVFLIMILPATAAVLPGVELTAVRALLPLFGPALVMREAMSGTLTWGPLLVGFMGALGLAVASLGMAARAFTVEALVTGRIARPIKTRGPLSSFDGVLLMMAVAAAFIVIGIPLQQQDLVLGLVVSQLAVFAGLPMLWAWFRSSTPLETLGLSRAMSPGAVPLILGGLLLLPTLGTLVSIPASDMLTREEVEAFEQMADVLAALPGPLVFVLVAVLPGVCEEITFRGAFMRSFASRPAVAIMSSALIFAVFHGSMARLIPTFVLGVLVGAIAWLCQSTWASIILHVSHNGFAILLAALLGLDAQSSESPYLQLPWAVHVLVVPGLLLLIWGAKRSKPKVGQDDGSSLDSFSAGT